MRRVSKEEILWLTRAITKDARTLGLIPEEATVSYRRGSVTNGHPPLVMVMAISPTGHVPVSFLPTFTYKHTAKDVHLALTATRLALEAAATNKALSDLRAQQ